MTIFDDVPNLGGVVVVESLMDEARAKIREDKRRAAVDQHRRAATLNDSIRRPGISERVSDKLEAAEAARDTAARLATRGVKENRKQISEHLRHARHLDMEAHALNAQELDDNWRYGAVAETIGLAMSRGDDVEHETVEMETLVKGEFGEQLFHRKGELAGLPVIQVDRVHRTVIRTGLPHAYEKGHLEGDKGAPKASALYTVGCMYGEAYEVSVGRCGSNGDGSGGGGAKGPQLRIVEAGETLAIMRRGLSDRQLVVLDRVCGAGERARQVATSMKAGFPATQRALRGGLGRCLDNWTEAMNEGEPGKAARRVKAAGRVVAKAMAELHIKVRVTDTPPSKADLRRLVQSGQRVEAATARLKAHADQLRRSEVDDAVLLAAQAKRSPTR